MQKLVDIYICASICAYKFFMCSRFLLSLYLDWRMVLVDLRNHGRSAEKIESFSPPHDMASAAKDLADLINTQGWAWPDVILGHSMGGKVALQFTESCARGDYGESAQLPKQVLF